MTAISVVMGVPNAGPVLAETLESILSQSEHDFECIAVDDGSTDSTADILTRFAAQDPRLRVMRQEHEGLPRALMFRPARSDKGSDRPRATTPIIRSHP